MTRAPHLSAHFSRLLLLVLTTLALAACRSSKHAADTSSGTGLAAEAYMQKVVANHQTEKALTARLKLRMALGDKDLSVGGTLRMKRDDVIQLSLTFLGMEVGRMEFAPDEVLIIDRMNRRYARVGYAKVDFLRAANLDFYALQSIFWNEIFVPGTTSPVNQLSQFSVASSGDHTLLSLTSAPKLDYGFLTQTATARLARTTISPKNIENTDNLVCKYDDFRTVGGQAFPTTINVSFNGERTVALNMSLSSLNNSTDWDAHTQVNSKYQQMDIEKMLGSLGSIMQ